MSNPNPRKRPAPGSDSAVPTQQAPVMINPAAPGDHLLPWNGIGEPSFDSNYGLVRAQGQFPPAAAAESNSLTRRPAGRSRALVPANQPPPSFNAAGDAWPHIGDDAQLFAGQKVNGNETNQESIESMEERALKVKKEAEDKRKQIPPFVQKLSSFLEERKNELIRWSENGDSFVVLDEDEFAKTLIPELFKHNNYASFVRQLNMYGFHKRVGLSDNSMRASERKNKSPSEYSNPYFRRGHPNLLWLINKPKSGTKPKKATGGSNAEMDSDEDGVDDAAGQGPGASSNAVLCNGHQNLDYIPSVRRELTQMQKELSMIKKQQSLLVSGLSRLQNNNTDLFAKVMDLQNINEHHHNSINTILSFLVNVFRKRVHDQAGGAPQNMNDVLSHIMASPNLHQGTVFDLDDLSQDHHHHGHGHGHGHAAAAATAATAVATAPGSATVMNVHKKARGLLPPIPGHGDGGNVNGNGAADAVNGTDGAGLDFGLGLNGSGGSVLPMGTVTELSEPSPSDPASPNVPSVLSRELETSPQEKMMQIIRDTNAGRTTGIDIPAIIANAPSRLGGDPGHALASIIAARPPPPSPALTTSQPAQSKPPTPLAPMTPGPFAAPSPSDHQAAAAAAAAAARFPPPTSAPVTAAAAAAAATVPALALSQLPVGSDPRVADSLHAVDSTIRSLVPLLPALTGSALGGLAHDQAELERLEAMSADSTARISNLRSRIESFVPSLAANANADVAHFLDGLGPEDDFVDDSGLFPSDIFTTDFVHDPADYPADYGGFDLGDPAGAPPEARGRNDAGMETASPSGTEEIHRDDPSFDGGSEQPPAKRRREA